MLCRTGTIGEPVIKGKNGGNEGQTGWIGRS